MDRRVFLSAVLFACGCGEKDTHKDVATAGPDRTSATNSNQRSTGTDFHEGVPRIGVIHEGRAYGTAFRACNDSHAQPLRTHSTNAFCTLPLSEEPEHHTSRG